MLIPPLVILFFVIQVACALFFVSDIVVTILGLNVAPMSWHLREVMELGAALGLVTGVGFGGLAVAHTLRSHRRVEGRLRAASGAFMDLLDDQFRDWGLTPAERDVALFSVKGLSTQEIARLRNTSEGTVKAQSNAIYRKAGVSGRAQLLGLFIEDLIGDALPGVEDAREQD
ncbi:MULTISPECIES: helix-turn-helix transcriptional regulator [Sediminimonas]|uniref:Response regulator transcription factor n=1 Tax=Sediminimonas qiaohouensis TaxID=552061 RepID=A0A7C9LLM0_9RHOB|nr:MULTISPECIES: LuxR C-terminal-related transcriptional regulator [Sediminimonas]MDR9486172.1 LuxR C-terminal-related transcriptional regulator [Sediminimonas sp.]MTJ04899.1 response regulator transcription factor [Sediminimonas qiaohouensis]